MVIVTGVLWVGGGAEKVAATLGNQLLERGYNVHLLTFYEHRDKYPYHGTYHSFNEQPRGKLAKLWGIPLRIYRIARYIKQHDIDFCYTFLEEANFYTLVARRLFRITAPVVVSVRNNTRSRSWLVQRLMRWLYPAARSVVCVTRGVEEMLREDHNLRNLTTIYNPIDIAATKVRAAETLPAAHQWLASTTPLYIHIGRHTHQKGQWSLLRAFAALVTQQPAAQLVMLGDGPDTARLSAFISELGLDESVHLLGKQTNVLPYLQAADVAVSSSLWEGMPNTLLEALSVGTPIVATDCATGPREILAPELTPNETISYPYHTACGTLTTPLPDEPCYQPPSEVLLTPAEQQLATTMLAALTSQYDHAAFAARSAEFGLAETIDQWEGLLRK